MPMSAIEPDTGYMGDTRRGASLGRGNVKGDPDTGVRFYLQRMQLDSGGYDSGGAYWGHGGRLYRYESEDGEASGTLRVWEADKAAAFKARGGVPIGEPGYDSGAFHGWHRRGWREAAKDMVREEYPDARFFR